ncbi:MAG TPA: zf-HC2 domain-containing protein [Actinomycetota bacterium]|nr:zf-HC2 domain-containing protein [Actinomycetota bacterium]
MSASCRDVRALVPELALGVATGEERARALEHLAECLACRRELDELTEVTDALLLAGPRAEPPVGFESRVVERVSAGTAAPRRKVRRAAGWAAAAVLGAALALGAAFLATGEQRDFAASYRRALEQAEGSYFGGLSLTGPGGRQAGHVFGYEGSPPWVVVIVTSGASGGYDVEVETLAGESVPLGGFEVVEGQGSFGTTLPVDLSDVAALRVEARDGPTVLSATAPPPAG